MDTCFVADMGSQNPVDFNKLKAANYNGVPCVGTILRATRSNALIDTAFASRADEAGKLGFLVGAYAFNTGETAQVQADRFKNATQSVGAILRALDFETNPGGRQMTLASAIEFMDRTDQSFGAATWFYSGDRIKSLVVSATDAQRQFLSEHPFWLAEYGPKARMADDDGHALPWEKYDLWQFTGDGAGPSPHTMDGLQAGADLSVFHGSAAQLALIWPGAPKVAAPPVASAESMTQEILSILESALKS